MEKKAIEEKIWEIISNIKGKEVNYKKNDDELTGRYYNLDSVDMVYLVLEIQKFFMVKIEKKDLDNYGFLTVEKISNIVFQKKLI
ncbi:MAG: acyl carrier protein [Lachnospiraceae bacterium]|nr:acyl carrier protein [Lachnospiraceae bacterium]